jgi:hypothetical protein
MSAFSRPIHVRSDGAATLLERVPLGTSDSQYSEQWLQTILFGHPETLPITEIDPHVGTLVPICMELETGAGPADILYVTRTGQLVLVETKLWRNAEARRVVVAQILDYAKELSHWSYEDLARETARASKGGAGYLLERVRALHADLDEAAFVDGINRSLAGGDFILIIAGDGIRSGAEALVSFIERYGHLRFQFALIEVASYKLADGALLLHPRVLARTELLRRTVYVTPQGNTVSSLDTVADEAPADATQKTAQAAVGDRWERFWKEYLDELELDDMRQAPPVRAPRNPMIYLHLPPGDRHLAWITAYVMPSENRAGVFLSLGKNLAQASEWYDCLYEQREAIEAVIPGLAWQKGGDGTFRVEASRIRLADLEQPAERAAVLRQLRVVTNDMVNAFRHRLDVLNKNEGITAS